MRAIHGQLRRTGGPFDHAQGRPEWNRRGGRAFVLIAVLLIILLLAVILMEFSHETSIGLAVSGNTYWSEQARNCAEAGVAVALAVVRQSQDPFQDESLRKLLDASTPISVGDGVCRVTLAREDGRLNINRLKTANGEIDRPRVERLLRLVDLLNAQEGRENLISYSTVAAMIDWADADDDTTVLPWVQGENAGAENDYYLSLTPPHLCKNAPFDSLDELLMVKGMTREILDGRPGNADQRIKPLDGLRNCLTVYGDGLVDINQAPSLVLQSLAPDITAEVAQAILDRRTARPFQVAAEVRLVNGVTQAAYDAIKNDITASPQSRYYSILSVGTVNGIEAPVQVVVKAQGVNNEPTVLWRKEL